MSRTIDLSNLGGLPLEQDTLAFMQLCYKDALAAIANLCGDKTILYGVETIAGNVTPGYISYNGELIMFQGGVLAADVVISETPTSVTFEDGNIIETYFVKTATVGSSGDFPFADLERISPLKCLAGEIKELFITNTDMAAEFDVDGYGVAKYKGWRKLSSLYAAAAGAVSVNHNAGDADFDECGKNGGAKTHALTMAQLPALNALGLDGSIPVAEGAGGLIKKSVTGATTTSSGADALGSGTQPDIVSISPFPNLGSGTAHNNLQPYFVTLKIVKL